jgi:hypothetical protein
MMVALRAKAFPGRGLRVRLFLVLLALSPDLRAEDDATRDAPTSPNASPRPQVPTRLSATSALTVAYAGDNRDTQRGNVQSLANDSFAYALERLTLQGTHGPWSLSVRVDGAAYPLSPNPAQIGLDLVALRGTDAGESSLTNAAYFRAKVFEAGTELSNRYINWIYPAKYALSYEGQSAAFTLGDFYAQLGHGLVLSVRKQDELSSDTTLRGGRAEFRTTAGQARLGAKLLYGVANPLRIDEPSGRYLGVSPGELVGLANATEFLMPYAIGGDFAGSPSSCQSATTCSYAPDDVLGGQVAVRFPQVHFETQAAAVFRHALMTNDIVRGADRIVVYSQRVAIPKLFGQVALDAELAGQSRRYVSGPSEAAPIQEQEEGAGYAGYASLDFAKGAFSLHLETKHYRAFYALQAGIRSDRAREFLPIQYSRLPTTEEVWNDTEFAGMNNCVSGGRLRPTLSLAQNLSLIGWIGHQTTWSESVENTRCDVQDEFKSTIWDAAQGFEIQERSGSHHQLLLGARHDESSRELDTPAGPTHLFYREVYARYDSTFHLVGPYSLHLQGWHRYRVQTLGGPERPFEQGFHLTSLDVAALGTVGMGVEYDTDPRTPDVYLNGQLTYRINPGSNLTLFVGQRRGALRCIGGVCRVFPPFEGARMDLTLRF